MTVGVTDNVTAPVVILASASPRRTELLAQIGVPHRVVPAQIDERRAAGEPIEDCVRRLARNKALEVQVALAAVAGAATAVEFAVLGADTAVVIDDDLLGKPRDRADALAMLARLSGRWHQVLSAVALASANGMQCSLSRSEVRFRAWASASARSIGTAASRAIRRAPMRSRDWARHSSRSCAAATRAWWVCRCSRRRDLLAEAGVPVWGSAAGLRT